MIARTLKPLLVALAFAGAAGGRSAYAADNGAYVGANIGGSRYQDSVNGVSGDGNALTGKVYGGYQPPRHRA